MVTLPTALGARPSFNDVTRAAGISFRHENGMTGKYYYPEIMGGGVGLFDFNGDGFLDIYFVNGNRLVDGPSPDLKNRLYRNNGDWSFTDVTDRAGVGDTGYGQGCCAGDYDNDGDVDLYLSNFGPDVLYRNNGDGTFASVARAAGVEDPGWGQTSSFLDYDGDGWLDLYVQNYLTYSLEKHTEAFILVEGKKVLSWDADQLPYDVGSVLGGAVRGSQPRDEQAQAEIGVTGCHGAIAETGSLAVLSGRGCSRSPTGSRRSSRARSRWSAPPSCCSSSTCDSPSPPSR